MVWPNARAQSAYSDARNALFTVVQHTWGSHNTIAGRCSEAINFLRHGVRNAPNCYVNFLEILGQFGLGRNEIVANINFFMYVPVVKDGKMAIVHGPSKPGSFVELRAARACGLVQLAANAQPCNAYNPTPIRCIVRRPS